MIENIKEYFGENADLMLNLGTAIVVIIIVLIIGYIVYKNYKRQREDILVAELNYKNALKQHDKQDALKKGRFYYSLLRGGNLTMYDEQAISNDLSTMKE